MEIAICYNDLVCHLSCVLDYYECIFTILMALAHFYFQVTDIWFEHLGKLVGQRTKTPAEPSGIGPAFNSGVPTDFDVLGTKMWNVC